MKSIMANGNGNEGSGKKEIRKDTRPGDAIPRAARCPSYELA